MEQIHALSLCEDFAKTLASLLDDLDLATSGELDATGNARFADRARAAVQMYRGLVAQLDACSVRLAYQFARRHGGHVSELQRALGAMQREVASGSASRSRSSVSS